MKKIYRCKRVSKGQVSGGALCSTDSILFYHTDAKTGVITEHGHCLEGRCISGRIVVFPGGKGSSSVQADGLYHLDCCRTAPSGFIVEDLDTVLVSCAIIMGIPMVCKVEQEFYADVRDGDHIVLDADGETVAIVRDDDV